MCKWEGSYEIVSRGQVQFLRIFICLEIVLGVFIKMWIHVGISGDVCLPFSILGTFFKQPFLILWLKHPSFKHFLENYCSFLGKKCRLNSRTEIKLVPGGLTSKSRLVSHSKSTSCLVSWEVRTKVSFGESRTIK